MWAALLERAAEKGAIRPILVGLVFDSLDGDRVIARCTDRALAMAQRIAPQAGEMLSAIAGRALVLDVRPGAPDPPGPAAPGNAVAGPSAAQAGPSAREHPLVKEAVELFGARIVRITPRRPAANPGG